MNTSELPSLEKPIRVLNKKMVIHASAISISALCLVIYLIPSSPKQESSGFNARQKSRTVWSDEQKFAELKQLPESYDGLKSSRPMASTSLSAQDWQEPQDLQYQQNNTQDTRESEQEEAQRSSVLFKTERSGEIFKERVSQTSVNSTINYQTKTDSQFAVLQGTLIPAVLLSEINTDLSGAILAQVTDSIFNTTTGKHLLIPQGSKLIGEYSSSVTEGQVRAQVVWNRLLFPDGSSVNLGRMPSVDHSGASGHSGSVNNHYDKLILGVLVTSLLSSSVGISLGQGKAFDSSPHQVIGQSLGQEVARVGSKLAERALNVSPTIRIKSGTKIKVFTTSDLQLVPIRQKKRSN